MEMVLIETLQPWNVPTLESLNAIDEAVAVERTLGSVTSQIDVLLPAYNVGRFLSETLESIQAQTVRNIRIIVVDDGSTDNTAAVLAKAAALDPRIQVITQPNGGIVAAMNAGLAACVAPFIARHDADDLSNPDRFERQLQYLKANPECLAVAGPARQIDEAGRDLGTQTRLRDLTKADENAVPAYEPYLLHPMLMVRCDAIKAIGGYRLVLNAEDSDLYWRLREHGHLHNLTDPLGSYRMHKGSVTSQSIASGRRGALYAQLAAISAQRRARKQLVLVFDSDLLTSIKNSQELQSMYAAAGRHLTDREQGWLAVAVSAKLMELCFYRPYELTIADCRFIRSAMDKHQREIPEDSVTSVREATIGTAVRLMKRGKVRSAVILTGNKLLPLMGLRLGFRMLLPDALRDRIKRLSGRG